MWRQTGPKSAPPGIPTLREVGLLFWSFLLWGALGAPFEHRVPKCHSRSSKMSPKMGENHRTVPSTSSKNKQKTPEYGYQVLVKKSKHKMVGIPPCISCFLGARILGRVWIPVFSKKQLKKNGGRSALYFRFFWCSDFRQSMDASCQ